MNARVQLSKEVEFIDTNPSLYKLKLSVKSAENITHNIFVVRYIPGSKYTGPEKYTFWNVAYLDELTSIPETPINTRKSCDVRKSCIEYVCNSAAELEDFTSTVFSDIKRLLKSVNTQGTLVACSNVDITADSAVELPCEDSPTDVGTTTPDNEQNTVINLSFTGE